MELVTGATGYVGARLVRRLRREGRSVRALARRPGGWSRLPGVSRSRATCSAGAARRALDGCETAYYLVHSMEARRRRRRAASPPATAAPPTTSPARPRTAGVERIVYLGGLAPAGRPRPPTSRSGSRWRRSCSTRCPRSTALRASIVIGAGSSSFRLLVRLVERLRAPAAAALAPNRTQPIDERDVIEFLARTPAVPAAAGRSLDIAGPDVVTYAALIERIAEATRRRAHAGGPARLAHPARERGGGGGDAASRSSSCAR